MVICSLLLAKEQKTLLTLVMMLSYSVQYVFQNTTNNKLLQTFFQIWKN